MAYIFGSVATGSCSPGSDIDLYVEDIRPEMFWALWRDLEMRADQPVDLYCQLDDPVFVSIIKE
ncbi:MAG: nucleotidyltransferase domain-containing protein, partial [Deltaproteobacteria bacterium]|nr:nucleotidyltransferase domain-containing protein [Deltaproteobacteria bacterium]